MFHGGRWPAGGVSRRWWMLIGYALSIALILKGLRNFGPPFLLGLELFAITLIAAHARAWYPRLPGRRQWSLRPVYSALTMLCVGLALLGLIVRPPVESTRFIASSASASPIVPYNAPTAMPTAGSPIASPAVSPRVSTARRQPPVRAGARLTAAHTTPVTPSRTLNPIQIENARQGTSSWEITKRTIPRHLIEGYADLTSVNLGQSIGFYVNVAPATPYTIQVYRMGWYQGLGARLMYSTPNLRGRPQATCPLTSDTHMVHCDWTRSYSLPIPRTWTTGEYLALLTRSDGYQNYMIFVVRDDSSTAAYLFQSSVTTFEAYNDWGGNSLYGADDMERFNSNVRAYQVTFDRPYSYPTHGPYEFLDWEYEMVRWMEREGYDIAYATDIDTNQLPQMLLRHRAFLSVGHDEYWSSGMRANVENALSHGVNLGFFGADASYWHIRLGRSALGANRIITCYKSAQLDPLNGVHNAEVTVQWRQPPLNKPENALVGQMYNGITTGTTGFPLVVSNSHSWIYNGVDVKDGTALPNVVGYEYDQVVNNGSSPRGLSVVARSPIIDDQGRRNVSNATVYTAPSGATVFSAGSIQWADSLDNYAHERVRALDSRMQLMTANILARLGQRPGGAPLALPATPGSSGVSGAVAATAPWRVTVAARRAMAATWVANIKTVTHETAYIHFHAARPLPTRSPSIGLAQTIKKFHTVPGRVYTLRFSGRVSNTRVVTVSIYHAAHDPRLAKVGLTLGHLWQTYEFTFLAVSDQTGIMVVFSLDPTIVGDIWLKDITLS